MCVIYVVCSGLSIYGEFRIMCLFVKMCPNVKKNAIVDNAGLISAPTHLIILMSIQDILKTRTFIPKFHLLMILPTHIVV